MLTPCTEYTEEKSNYGLVNLYSNGSAKLLPDFDVLQSQFNTLNITLLQGVTAQKASVVPPTCKSSLITTKSGITNNFTVPALPPGAQTLIDNGIAKPNNGKLVSVTQLDVSQVVEASNGVILTGLAIKPLADNESNVPSGETSPATPTTTSTAPPAATTSKTGAGLNLRRNLATLAFGSLSVFVWLLLS